MNSESPASAPWISQLIDRWETREQGSPAGQGRVSCTRDNCRYAAAVIVRYNKGAARKHQEASKMGRTVIS